MKNSPSGHEAFFPQTWWESHGGHQMFYPQPLWEITRKLLNFENSLNGC
jgi:hypothetical protein